MHQNIFTASPSARTAWSGFVFGTMGSRWVSTGLSAGLSVLGAAIALGLSVSPSFAQDTGCFMVDAKGNQISLGALCGYGKPSPAAPAAGRSAGTGATGVGGTQAGLNAGVVQVPILRRTGLTPVIGVTFNGQKTYEMILDTGASGTLITRRMAQELGVKSNGVVQAQIADGSRVEFPIGKIQTIAVETAQVSNVDVAIAQDMEIGLLGHDFFGEFDISIRENVVEFSPR